MARNPPPDHETSPAADRAPPAFGDERLVVVLVGLPARGKTTLAKKLGRYLGWLGHPTRTFNVGSYRRARLGSRQRHEFFDPSNPEGEARRLEMAVAALDDMLAWLDGPEAASGGLRGAVAFYDATNTRRDRRALVAGECASRGVDVLFVETVVTDPAVIEGHVRAAKVSSPDYAGLDPEAAARDFRQRIGHYERAYQPLTDDEGSIVRVFDFGKSIEASNVRGEVPLRILSFLVRGHGAPRRIWLTRHGESEFNVGGRIGGDSPLTKRGRAYAIRLGELIEQRCAATAGVASAHAPPEARASQPDIPLVWTSCLRRTIETAAPLPWPARPWRALDEIHAGICDGLTYSEIAARWPAEYAARAADKLRYRYPRGESYEDVFERLEPVVLEIESARRPVLIVAHQAVLRVLYGYLTDRPRAECPRITLPLHTVFEIRIRGDVWEQDAWSIQREPSDAQDLGGPARLGQPIQGWTQHPAAPDSAVDGPLRGPRQERGR